MKRVFTIAADEARYWWRSRLAWIAFAALALLAVIVTLHSSADLAAERAARTSQQSEAHEAFLDQPNRHPHRMVHYGHYVFRTPPPLAAIDPGVDAFTGRSMFLEGHRQNTPTFARARETALLSRFGELSPAFVLQVLAPLLLILIGFSSVVRERETGTLLQLLSHGVRPGTLLLGKGLALAGVAAAVLAPLAVATLAPVAAGTESLLPAATLLLAYTLYLAIVCCAILWVSSRLRRRAAVLGALLAGWVAIAIIVPRVASEWAAAAAPAPSKTEADLAAGAALRAAGDSHNPSDAAFATLEQRLLAQYGVATIAELPINYRGLVSLEGERSTSEVYERFAAERRAREQQQSGVARRLTWLSPSLALKYASMASAGTDLDNHHRFLVAAEAHRYRFVQALNRLHAEELTYADDSARSRDAAAEQRTRIDSNNWALLPEFDFANAEPAERVDAALPMVGVLVGWLVALVGLLVVRARSVLW